MHPSFELRGVGNGPTAIPNSIGAVEGVGGLLFPGTSSLLGRAVDAAGSISGGQPDQVLGAALGGTAGAASYFRESVPWNSIADWTHSLEKTPTDRWMDVVDGATRGPNHRWLRHHPVDFAREWLHQGAEGELKLSHYIRHLGLDAITTKGIPLLPEVVHSKLVEFGIPRQMLYDWTHVNVFDITVGAVSVADGGYQMFLSITGHIPWEGAKTLVLTFGIGGAEIIGGFVTDNPFLVVGGALRCGSGAVSYWNHVHVPVDSMLPHLAHGLLGGVGSGCIVSMLRLGLTWGKTSPLEKAALACESIVLSSTLGCLAVISPWLSIPIGLSYGLGKLAFRYAQSEHDLWKRFPMSSPFTSQLSSETIRKYGGVGAIEDFERYLATSTALNPDPALVRCLQRIPGWGELPETLAHVFGTRKNAGQLLKSQTYG